MTSIPQVRLVAFIPLQSRWDHLTRSDWEVEPNWKPGDTDPTWVKTSYDWDATAPGDEYNFQPDVAIGLSVTDPDGFPVPNLNTFPWSEESWRQADEIDHIRCDTKGSGSAVNGCVFLNVAPTYPFNAANYPRPPRTLG